MNASSATAFSSDIENIDSSISANASILVYRIVQEAVNNVLLHAEATKASITIRHVLRAVEIVVQDNGKGLPGRSDHSNGFGLSGIEQRVRMLDGTLVIHSSPATGTTLSITLPVET
jgi:signal transduction histidine kinase